MEIIKPKLLPPVALLELKSTKKGDCGKGSPEPCWGAYNAYSNPIAKLGLGRGVKGGKGEGRTEKEKEDMREEKEKKGRKEKDRGEEKGKGGNAISRFVFYNVTTKQ